MKYDVHIYAVVRVKVPGVEAESQTDAIEQAEEQVDFNALFDSRRFSLYPGIECVEYADETSGYLVDEEGDEEHDRSSFYKYDTNRGKLVKD
jgi:hypothetical protein